MVKNLIKKTSLSCHLRFVCEKKPSVKRKKVSTDRQYKGKRKRVPTDRQINKIKDQEYIIDSLAKQLDFQIDDNRSLLKERKRMKRDIELSKEIIEKYVIALTNLREKNEKYKRAIPKMVAEINQLQQENNLLMNN